MKRPVAVAGVLSGLLGVATAVAGAATYEPQRRITLWEGQPPLADGQQLGENEMVADQRIGHRVTRVTIPELWVYPAGQPDPAGTAVIICPGGGYNILAVDHEGTEVAQWLNGLGVHAFVLLYRVPRSQEHPHHLPPLRDAQQAVRMVRQQADQWGMEFRQLGILGFSAGGNLAALVSSPADAETSQDPKSSGVAAPTVTSRPDFTVLVYPAYLSESDDRPQLTPLVHVTEQSPPAILIHTGDDPISVTGSIAYYLALRSQRVPAALHVYPRGGHGYGLRPSENAVSHWPARVEAWMRHEGLLQVADDATGKAADAAASP